jgi:molecular chaperone DnaK (HSP70)
MSYVGRMQKKLKVTKPEYFIGIDLGTTHCALSFVNLASASKRSSVFKVEQHTAANQFQRLELLPSALYFPPQEDKWICGAWADSQLAATPERVVVSAKSWLVHGNIDRHQKILPWHSEDIPAEHKLSPVEASSLLLRHLKEQWNAQPQLPDFNNQLITITVPASFDEAAQALTLEAAQRADYPEKIHLLEEPQAAFYFFLEQHKKIFDSSLFPKRPLTMLVCDIGGGTCDFSLVVLDDSGELERIDVSNHILLGGDNIDLALARAIEHKLTAQLTTRQWQILVSHAKRIKEQALSSYNEQQEFQINIPSEGSDLFANAISTSISKEEIETVILDGFFPRCSASARPKKSGLREIGLPYASDSAFTKHLAEFLKGRKVHAILCTGGTLTPHNLQSLLRDLLQEWQESSVQLLPNDSMTLAVARGAARYGLSLYSEETRIKSGYPHAVYLALESEQSPEAICILPQRSRPGSSIPCSRQLQALLGLEVQFQLVTSTGYPEDQSGTVRIIDTTFHALPPFHSILECPLRERGTRVTVDLLAEVSETGLLQLFCRQIEGDRSWEVKINLRISEHSESICSEDQPELQQAEEFLRSAWGKATRGKKPIVLPKGVVSHLEKLLTTEKTSWNVHTLRTLWTFLSPGITRRGRSVLHESQFFALAGYVLRPGYGVALDNLRMAELWKCFDLGLNHPKERPVLQQWWIMWRRVAGGLTATQQLALMNSIQSNHLKEPEVLRLLGSLEYLAKDTKRSLVQKLVKEIKQPSKTQHYHIWTLQRLISRLPLYADPIYTLEPEEIVKCFEQLKGHIVDSQALAFAFLQGFRLSGVRGMDVEQRKRQELAELLEHHRVPNSELEILWKVRLREEQETLAMFGEHLPVGLTL